MANEAVIIELFGEPKGQVLRFAVPNAYAVEKGTLMAFSGAAARTVSKNIEGTVGAPFAGVAAEEKVTSDGSTSMGVYTKGVFDLAYTANTVAVVPGDMVILSGANKVTRCPDSFSGSHMGWVVGKVLEPVAAAASDTVAVQIGG